VNDTQITGRNKESRKQKAGGPKGRHIPLPCSLCRAFGAVATDITPAVPAGCDAGGFLIFCDLLERCSGRSVTSPPARSRLVL